MEKKIEDFLHLYFGAPCLFGVIVPGQPTQFDDHWNVNTRILHNVLSGLAECKLLLRKLSDMTEEEAKELWRLHMHIYGNSDLEGIVLCASAITNYLRSIHVDCDSLTESGLAISSK